MPVEIGDKIITKQDFNVNEIDFKKGMVGIVAGLHWKGNVSLNGEKYLKTTILVKWFFQNKLLHDGCSNDFKLEKRCGYWIPSKMVKKVSDEVFNVALVVSSL